jgi:hypothetical protein
MKSFQLVGAPASLQSTENVRTARAQAPEVKSDSRYVRFVIAKHSPERVSATGLRIEAREKNRCNGSDAAERSFSLVRFVEEIPRKVGLFRLFQEKRSRVSLQLRLRGGEGGIRSLPRPTASITCRFYIATYAKFATVAAHHCTLLHARHFAAFGLEPGITLVHALK